MSRFSSAFCSGWNEGEAKAFGHALDDGLVDLRFDVAEEIGRSRTACRCSRCRPRRRCVRRNPRSMKMGYSPTTKLSDGECP